MALNEKAQKNDQMMSGDVFHIFYGEFFFAHGWSIFIYFYLCFYMMFVLFQRIQFSYLLVFELVNSNALELQLENSAKVKAAVQHGLAIPVPNPFWGVDH